MLHVFSAVAVWKLLKFVNKELHSVILQWDPEILWRVLTMSSKKASTEEGKWRRQAEEESEEAACS